MKKITLFGPIINLISLILIVLITKQLLIYHIILFILLIILFIFMLKKDEVKYLLLMFLISYNSIYLIINIDFNILVALYILGFILTSIYGYLYIFNMNNNKMRINLNKITIPNDKDYIVLKYLSGLPLNCIGNGIIYKDKDNLIIEIENDKDDKIYKKVITKSELDKITSNVKPYIVSKEKVLIRSYDHTRQYFTGVAHKNPEETLYTKSFKPIKSYQIEITLLNGEKILLLSFNNPEKFFVN